MNKANGLLWTKKYGFPPGRETEGVNERLEYGYRQIAGSCERSKKIIEKGTEEQKNLLAISKMKVVSFSSFLSSFIHGQYLFGEPIDYVHVHLHVHFI